MSDTHEEALRMWNTLLAHEGCLLELSALDAWLLVNACQLTATHPHLAAELRGKIGELGQRIAALFADNPQLSALLAAGWDRAHDEEHTTPLEETEAHVARILEGLSP